MLDAYRFELILTVVRMAVWFVVVFVVLPRRLFAPEREGGIVRQVLDHVVRMAFATVVIVHLLVLLGLFDVFSLVASYVLLHLGYLVVVTRRSPVLMARRAWRSLVVAILDALEAGRAVKGRLGAARAAAAALVPRGESFRCGLCMAAVLGVVAWTRLADAYGHPAPDSPAYYVRLTWLKALGGNDLYVEGVHPWGTEAILQALARFASPDEALLVRVAPGLAALLVTMTVYWAVTRLSANRAAGVVGAATYALLSVPGRGPLAGDDPLDALALDTAAAFLLPALVFVAEVLHGGVRNRRVLVATAAGCLALVHPLLALLGLAGLAGGWLAAYATERRLPAGAHWVWPAGFAGAALGLVPLGVALALQRPLYDGLLGLGHLLPGAAGQAAEPSGASLPAVLVLGGVVALVLVLVPGAAPGPVVFGPRVMAAALFVLVPAAIPERFGLPPLVDPGAVGRGLVPVLAAVFALGYRDLLAIVVPPLAPAVPGTSPGAGVPPVGPSEEHPAPALLPAPPPPEEAAVTGWRRPVAALATPVVATGLMAATVARPPPAGARLQTDEVVATLYRIKREFPAFSWTVVDQTLTLPQVAGKGFFLTRRGFVDTYDPATWRFDPARPELSVPTRHVFVFVPTRPARGLDGEPVEDGATLTDVASWVARYGELHEDMTRFFAGEDVAVHHIARDPDEERRIIEEYEEEQVRQRRAGG